MSKATDIRIVSASCAVESLPFRAPLKFGGRIVDKIVSRERGCGSRIARRESVTPAMDLGSMPLGNVWAWPSDTVTVEQSETAMRRFAEEIVDLANECSEFGHPIDLVYHLSGEYEHLAKSLSAQMKLPAADAGTGSIGCRQSL